MVLAGIGDIREETVVATKLLVAILLTAVVDQRLWKGQLTIDPPSTRIASLSIPTDSSRCLVSWWAVRGCWTCCLDVLQPLLSCRSFLFWGEKDGGCLVLRCALHGQMAAWTLIRGRRRTVSSAGSHCNFLYFLESFCKKGLYCANIFLNISYILFSQKKVICI